VETSNFGGSKRDQLERLSKQHSELKARVHELESHMSLTSTEQLELSQLKKRKLLTKDQLYTLGQR
jgi:uncharacterized protein YdcH (DUF465 family)